MIIFMCVYKIPLSAMDNILNYRLAMSNTQFVSGGFFNL